jgi:hypothetical protein
MLMKTIRNLIAGLLITATTMWASTVIAHHSSAMFDLTKSITLTGVVQEWQFTNPHAYLLLMADKPDAPGQTELWTCETGALNLLVRLGIRKDTFKAGDKVSVTMHPMRNGTAAGQLVSAIGADNVTHSFILP